MRRPRLGAEAALAAAVCLLPACGLFDDVCFPPAAPFSPGSYASQAGAWVNGKDVFPHDTGTPKTLVIERDSEGKGTVRPRPSGAATRRPAPAAPRTRSA